MESLLKPKVFAIVLNYNGKDCLISCLDSLYASDYENLEIVVVDNASTDGSLELAMKKFSRLHFIKNSKNIGFAAGNNVAIRFSLEKMASYVLLLNNDATIEKTAINKLVFEAEKSEKIGLLSPLILATDKLSVWFSGGEILWRKMKTIHFKNIISKKPYETGYATGCAMLIKKSVFRKIGLLDEAFFLYYEDADFSLRAKRADFKILVVPEATCCHMEKSETVNESKLYWLVLSGIIFFKKNAKGMNRLWINLYLSARKLKLLLRIAFGSNNDSLKQIRRAFNDYKAK